MIYNENWEAILEEWEQLNENQKNATIESELVPYYKIWDKLSPTQQEFVCHRKDLDYENYMSFLNKTQKRYIYGFNYNINLTDHWDDMVLNDKMFAIKHNSYLEIDELWTKMNNVLRSEIIDKRQDFDFVKYWDDLDNEQITIVIRHHSKELDISYYWNFFTDEHIKTLIMHDVIDFTDDEKYEYCLNLIVQNKELIRLLLPYSDYEEKLNEHYISNFDFNNKKPELKNRFILLNGILKDIHITNIDEFEKHKDCLDEIAMFRYDDMLLLRFYYPEKEAPIQSQSKWSSIANIDSIQYDFIILKNYINILRERKLKRILKIQ